ncbi:MAG: putative Ig domain-containing protein [Thermoleophilia bacterium]
MRIRPRLSVAVLAAVLCASTPAAGALPQQSGSVDLLTEANVRIDGAVAGDETGAASAAAGDVNGDGLADVIVGAGQAGHNGRAASGSAYVVFGSATPVDVDLANPGAAGFRIDGAAAGDVAGYSVGGAGDLNGDGFDDVVVGAPFADAAGRTDAGAAYVVFGSAAPADVDLAALGAAGFRIDGAASGEQAGRAVAAAGDVNADGLADAVLGAPLADPAGRTDAGSAYVVFGSATPSDVDLAAPGARGFRMDGGTPGEAAGVSVAGAGDVNGDGRADVVAGAPQASRNGRVLSGSAYVVFGSATPSDVDLAAPAGAAFRIDGAAGDDQAGIRVAGAGDVNGDGRDDVVLSAIQASNNGRYHSGSAYVVFGAAAPSGVDLASPGAAGLRIDGAAMLHAAGLSVAGPGDVNGDGRADVLVAAPYAGNRGRSGSGSVYVAYGFGSPSVAYGALSGTAGAPIAPHAPTGVARTGHATFSVSPALPAGLALDAATGVISGTPAYGLATTAFTVTMADLSGSVTASVPVTIEGPRQSPPAPPSGPSPDPAAPSPDVRAPRITLRIPAGPHAGPRVRVQARCDEDCRLVAAADGAGPVTLALRGGTWRWVTVTVARRAASRGGPVRVRLVATDAAGNRSELSRTVRLLRGR